MTERAQTQDGECRTCNECGWRDFLLVQFGIEGKNGKNSARIEAVDKRLDESENDMKEVRIRTNALESSTAKIMLMIAAGTGVSQGLIKLLGALGQ